MGDLDYEVHNSTLDNELSMKMSNVKKVMVTRAAKKSSHSQPTSERKA